MGVWHLDIDVLARSRFKISPLAETVASFLTLSGFDANHARRAWTAAHRPAYEAFLAADPFMTLFVRAAFSPRWLPDVLTVPPQEDDTTFEDELRQVRSKPSEVAIAEIESGLGHPVPDALRVPDLTERVADHLTWIWTTTVRPGWPRLRQIFEADIIARTHRLSQSGWAAALDDMRTGMGWLGDGRLQINVFDYPPRDLTDSQLLFIPTTTHRGWVEWDQTDRYAIVYPCTGLLASPPAPTPTLAKLLGPVRALLLTLLDTPKSTTQLVALTGYALGSVGAHLKILLEAQLIQRRRAGRSVLYYRTPLGDQLVAPA